MPQVTQFGPAGFQGIQLVRNVPQQRRVFRKPKHTAYTKQYPWEITPFMIAPVLPGETLENLLFQGNVRSDPLKADVQQVGWWHEVYFFYVKFTDIEHVFAPEAPGTFIEMFLSTTFNPATVAGLAPTGGAIEEATYHNGEGVNWLALALATVVPWYFRNEGEGTFDYVGPSGLPLASTNATHFSDTLAPDAGVAEGGENEELPGEVDDFSNLNVPAGFEAAFNMYQQLIASGVTDATFEDYLKTYGVRPPREVQEVIHKPELVRYLRDWQYPRAAADVTTGAPAAIVEWKTADRADKARRFNEPGFIIGLTVARPKIFFGNQSASMVNFMADAYSWLPAVLREEAYTSLRKIDNTTGPFKDVFGEDYWVDIKDLFLHGDQFTNQYGIGVPNSVALPTEDYVRRYVHGSNMIVVGTEGEVPIFGDMFSDPAFCQFTMDAVVTMNIRGQVRETTPGPGAPAVAVP